MKASSTALSCMVAAAAVVVTFVFFATRPTTISSGLLQYLAELEAAEAALNENVLKARQRLLTNYDPLVDDLDRGRKVLSEIRAEALVQFDSDASVISRNLHKLAAIQQRREIILEDFKTDNAVLENSVHYFLLLSDQLLRPRDAASTLPRAAVRDLHELRDRIATYLATADQAHHREAAVLLTRLQQNGPGDGPAATLALLARHAASILKHRDIVDREITSFLALTMAPPLAEMRRLYLERQAERTASVEATRMFLYGVALLLLVGLGFILFRLRASMALQEAKERAEASDKAKSNLLAHVSHELRTPLNAIMGFSDAIAAQLFGPISERYRGYAGDIHGAGEHLLQLINDLLDLSAVESEQLVLSDDRVEVAEAVSASLRLVEDRARAIGITLHSHVAEDLPMLHADERRVKQILINLLGNAVKFTPGPGRVTLNARCRDGLIEISVADTGPGIPASEIDDVMTPFGRSRDPRVRVTEGSGLGLPLARRLAELQGGSLRLESEVGRGTVVTLALPAAPPPAADSPNAAKP